MLDICSIPLLDNILDSNGHRLRQRWWPGSIVPWYQLPHQQPWVKPWPLTWEGREKRDIFLISSQRSQGHRDPTAIKTACFVLIPAVLEWNWERGRKRAKRRKFGAKVERHYPELLKQNLGGHPPAQPTFNTSTAALLPASLHLGNLLSLLWKDVCWKCKQSKKNKKQYELKEAKVIEL